MGVGRRIVSNAYFKPSRAFLTAFYLAVGLSLIGLPEFGGSSEAREAHIVASIYSNGTWLLPLRNEVLPSKPPLYHWLATLASLIVGEVNEFSVRLVSLLFASGVLFVSMLLAKKIAENSDQDAKEHASALALGTGAILATIYQFVKLSCDARVDMTFCFFVTLALYFLVAGYLKQASEPQQPLVVSPKYWNLFYASAGLAVLAKGPLGFLLCVIFGVSCLSVILGVRQALLEFITPRFAWVLGLFTATCWYIAAYLHAGAAILETQLAFENFMRFFGGEISVKIFSLFGNSELPSAYLRSVNSEPFWFYIPSFLRSAFPWSLIFLVALFIRLKELLQRGNQPKGETSGKDLAGLCFVVGFLFFSLASGKRHAYLLPLFPLMSIALSFSILEQFKNYSDAQLKTVKRGATVATYILGAVLFALAVTLWMGTSLERHANIYVSEAFRWLNLDGVRIKYLAALFFILTTALSCFSRRLKISAPHIIFASSLALLFLGICGSLGIKAHYKSFKPVAQLIASHAEKYPEVSLLKEQHEEFFDPMLFYIKREVYLLNLKDGKSSCFDADRPKTVYFSSYVHFKESGLEHESRVKILTTWAPPVPSWQSAGQLVIWRCEI